MIKKGDKVKRIGRDFREVKQGEIYTCTGTENMNNIYLEETNGDFGYAKDKFKKVEEFEVGEEVIYHHPIVGEIKAEIFGISDKKDIFGEDYAISYKIYGDINNAVTEKNKLSKIKSKDELEKGDKFIGKTGTEYEVVAREYDERSSMMKYFVKRDRDNKKVIGIVNEISIEEVIV